MNQYKLWIAVSLVAVTGCHEAGSTKQQSPPSKLPVAQPTLMHIAISAIDIDSTLHFYKNVFGYSERYEFSQTTNAQTKQTVYKGRGVYLDLGGKTYIELFPSGKPGQSMTNSAVVHFALLVKDVDEVYKKALQSGAKKYGFTEPTTWDGSPTTVTINGEPPLKEKVAFVEGLNGEVIEIYELLTPVPTKYNESEECTTS